MSKAINDLSKFIKKIEKAVGEALKPVALKRVGVFTTELVVKRTRLGYGVSENYRPKVKLKALSKKYIEARKSRLKLDTTTRPTKSNLTLTGQMLRSMSFEISNGLIVIKPTGTRSDSRYTNEQIAEFNADKGRVFNRISKAEFNQVKRFYRKTFGDLLRLKGLLK